MPGTVWAVVVAAGRGTRFGGAKQFALLSGSSVLDLAIAAMGPVADGIVAVLPAGERDSFAPISGDVLTAEGRATRAGSVRAGLERVPEEAEIILVHDAARPLASAGLSSAVVAAVRAGADAAIPGLVVADTVKRVEGDEVAETLERSSLVRVQTPQAFKATVLRRAHSSDAEATDDAALVEAGGGRVVVVPGEEWNVKITTPADLELAQWWHNRLVALDASPPR